MPRHSCLARISIWNTTAFLNQSFFFMKKLIYITLLLAISSIAYAQSCLPNGISFHTQQEIDDFPSNYPGCTAIGGKLTVLYSSDITNLDSLAQITSIGGYLQIANNPSLTSISGLSNLSSLGGYVLQINNNPALTSLSGLENLTSFDGDIDILFSNSLTSLAGLNNLSSLGGSLRLDNNPGLTSLAGLTNLSSIGGSLVIFHSAMTSLAGLDNITSIGSLHFRDNAALTSLSGLDNLTSLSGGITLSNNSALTSLTGLNNITSIGKNILIVDNHALTSLSGLDNLSSIGGYLRVIYNEALTSLSGIQNIDPNTIESQNSFFKDLEIHNNPNLSECEVQSICNFLDLPGKTKDIHDNMTGCNSVTEIETACTTPSCPINLTFKTQQEIDDFPSNYPGCTAIEGNVFIFVEPWATSYDITNLDSLVQITSIGGRLEIFHNPVLTSIEGLVNLTSVGESLVVTDNDALTSLAGLDNITSVPEDLSVLDNAALTSLSGLANITSIGKTLDISGNDALTSLAGLDNLASIGKDISIGHNNTLPSLTGLDNITSIGGRLYIFSNDALTSLAGLDNITTIGESLYITDNDALTSLSELNQLTAIGGFIHISENAALTSLSGIQNIDPNTIESPPTYFYDLYIFNNPNLSECEVQSICDFLDLPGKTKDIHDNMKGCNSVAEIEDACANVTPTDCGTIAGFTKLGEFDNHGYYLSENIMTWENAKMAAENAGGYLVSVNTQAENDFIQSHLDNNLVFIGLNDATTEGDLQWANGDPVTLDLSHGNSENGDYAIMNFWNGTWDMHNQWVAKRFILEMDCNSSPSGQLTVNCPAPIEVSTTTGSATASWDEPTATTTCPTGNAVTITQTAGSPSGSDFTIGTHTITYQISDLCGNTETCSFQITIVEGSTTDCGSIAGFTKLGDFDNHGYYLSENMMTWEEAKMAAENAGGYLVSVNTQAENDFIQSHLGNNLVFIGLNDASTEGVNQWANGDPVTLDLSYANSEENDFAVMNFWAGTWQMVNNLVRKQYILEMECGSPNTSVCGEIAGFEKLGEYNGDGYYLSNQEKTWSQAQINAQANGGYLATIQSQAENTFIQDHLGNNMAYIGFHDSNTEGLGEWGNQEPVTIDLSYANSEENDFAVMNFWAGTWQMVNPFVYKKYIMEKSCSTSALSSNNQFFLTLTQNQLVADLTWQIKDNSHTAYFVIERAADGRHFEPIGQISSDLASRTMTSYQFVDGEPLVGANYYRIVAVSLAGKKTVSNLEQGHFAERQQATLYPNPAGDFVVLDLLPFKGQDVDIFLTGQFGQPIQKIHVNHVNAEPLTIQLDQVINGIYQIHVRSESKQTATLKLVVAKQY